MIGFATITFRYDPDGLFLFCLSVWITEVKTKNLLGMDVFQKQVSVIHFDLPAIELRNPSFSLCFGGLYQNKPHPHLSQILTIRKTFTMYFDAKDAFCWKYLSDDSQFHFPPSSTLQPNRQAISSGLFFLNNLSPRREICLRILIQKFKNHQFTLHTGRIRYSSLDVLDNEELEYQIRSLYELTKVIIAFDGRYNDWVPL